MDPTLVRLLLAMAGRAAQQGTLIDIFETAAKLVRLIEPLIGAKPGPVSGQ